MTIPILILPTCLTVYADFYMNHCCDCASFDIDVTVFDTAGNASTTGIGTVNISGCGLIRNPGGPVEIPAGAVCVDEVEISCTCNPGNPSACPWWESSNYCHEGITIEFLSISANGTQRVIGSSNLDTSRPASLFYCEIFEQFYNLAP